MKFDLSSIQTSTPPTPDRIVDYGPEGTGKTSFWAHAPAPVFIMSEGETGLPKLKESGIVPADVAHFPEITTSFSKVDGARVSNADGWGKLLSAITTLVKEDHSYKTVVLDCLDGFEAMAHDYHCKMEYAGDMGPRGFMNFQNGYETAMCEIRRLTTALDALQARGMTVVLLAHSALVKQENPNGANYHRYIPGLNPKHTWPHVKGWADMVLFRTFDDKVIDVNENTGRGKAKGGKRVLHTERGATWDAKHRHGLPPKIELPSSAGDSYKLFEQLLTDGKKGTKE